METQETIRARVSAAAFDPDRPIDGEELRELVSLACRAPSSFNLQHWRFVAVTDARDRQRLQGVAHGQSKVGQAAAVLIVLGDLRGHELVTEALGPNVRRGDLTAAVADRWGQQALRHYAEPRLARDEAIRSASLAAMTLMLAAADRGLASAPLIGFDVERLRQEFQIPNRYVPVMLLALGHPARGEAHRPKVRFGLDRVLFEGDGAELPD
jgi:nitroreductase